MYNCSSNFSVSCFRSRVLALIILIVLLCSFVPSVSLAQQPTATINTLSGTVLVNGQEQGKGAALSAGDVIETQAGARVVLEFSDGSLLELGENTKLDMTELAQTATGARVSRVKLMWGWIRAKLSPGHQQAGSSFDIETPNALVGVKFSQPDVEVSYDPDKQETVGLARTVALSARNLLTNEELIVPVGSTVIITATTIKIVAGLLSLGKASDAIMEADTSQTKMPEPGATETEATGAAATEAEAAATGAETATTGTTEAGMVATIGGLSAKTLALVGLGVVAVGGGIAAIASGGGDDGNNGGSSSGANDSFTGTFVAQNVGEWGKNTFELSQNGRSVNGTYNGEDDVYGVGGRFTFFVTGTASGLSAELRCYNGQGYTPELGWYPLLYEVFYTATLVSNGNILRATEAEGITYDFIRQ